MRFSPIKLLHGLLYAAPVLLLTLVACGGGSSSTPTTPVVAPSAPTNIIATNVTNCSYRIQVSWNPVTGATGYNIYRDIVPSVQTTTPLNGSTVAANAYTDTSPASSKTYYYKITAVNSAGPSSPSAAASATTPATTNTCVNVGGSVQGSALASSTQVTTFAGKYQLPGSTDGPASTAQFNSPTAITTDGVNLYIADKDNDVIRKIDILSGTVSTVAGTALSPGSSNSPPLFNHPDGITIDPTGLYLYVSDTVNGSIRKIDLSTTPATVSTLAASIGVSGTPRGITIDQSGTYLYVADPTNGTIVQVNTATPNITAVVQSSLNAPVAITTDGSTLFFSEVGTGNLSTITIGTQGTIGSWTLNSGVTSGFNLAQGITSDGTNLYVTNSGSNTVDKVLKGSPWTKTTITGGSPGYVNGPVASALFNTPAGITTDGTYLYVVDTANSVIRKIQ